MRRIKSLSLAALAAFAIVAIMGVPAASAGYFTTEGEATVEVEGTPSWQEFSMPGNRTASCTTSPFYAALTPPAAELTPSLTPDMDCESNFEGDIAWEMNGCELSFQPGDEASEGVLDGTFEIGPAGCGPVELTSEWCQRLIAPQSGDATYANADGAVRVAAQDFLSYTVTKETLQCKPGSLSYRGDWDLTANSGGEPVDMQVIPSMVGVFLEGEQFQAERYPASLGATQDGEDEHVLTLQGGRKLKCETADFEGELSTASSQVALAPAYADCAIEVGESKLPTTVEANSCRYELAVAGTLGVGCGEEGDAIVITAYQNAEKQAEGKALCTFEFASQSGVGSVALSNFGEGNERGVELDFGVSGLAYTKVQGTIGNCGGFGTLSASYAGTSNLTGSVG